MPHHLLSNSSIPITPRLLFQRVHVGKFEWQAVAYATGSEPALDSMPAARVDLKVTSKLEKKKNVDAVRKRWRAQVRVYICVGKKECVLVHGRSKNLMILRKNIIKRVYFSKHTIGHLSFIFNCYDRISNGMLPATLMRHWAIDEISKTLFQKEPHNPPICRWCRPYSWWLLKLYTPRHSIKFIFFFKSGTSRINI